MKPLNPLTSQFTESVIRMMTRLCMDAGGINLAQGFPDWDAPRAIKDAAMAAVDGGQNQYAITFGQPGLRAAIARRAAEYNQIACDPDTEITVTCGSTEAMIACLKSLVQPGEEVVIFEPFYENYGPDTLLSGAEPRYVTLHAPDWRLDPEELAAAFGPKTKAVILNTPHNPTGKVFSQAEMELIAELCQKWDAYCVTDEIYDHILYDQAHHISMASLPGMARRTLTINSVSKTYSATGWRVGWVIAPSEVSAAVRKVHDFLTVGAPAPLQEAVAAALALPQSYYDDLRERYDQGRRYLYGVLEGLGFNPVLPGGAYYIITRPAALMARLGAEHDFDFAKKLIARTGVATVPGSSFYSRPELGHDQVRFCFCKRPEALKAAARGLERLKAL